MVITASWRFILRVLLGVVLGIGCALVAADTAHAQVVPTATTTPATVYDSPANLAAQATTSRAESGVAARLSIEHAGRLVAFPHELSAPRAPQQVIVDTNAVLNRPGVQGALGAGEVPVMTGTTQAELANLVAGGRIKMPHFASELGVIDDVMDVNTRINIRGMLEAMRRGQPGLFGDGAIGATAVRTGSPVITADRNFAAVLRSLGVEVRVP